MALCDAPVNRVAASSDLRSHFSLKKHITKRTSVCLRFTLAFIRRRFPPQCVLRDRSLYFLKRLKGVRGLISRKLISLLVCVCVCV